MPLVSAAAEEKPAPARLPGDRHRPLHSYDLYIDGRAVPGPGWVYTVSAESLMDDVFTSISLKRALERDDGSDLAEHPYVVGRCAFAGDEHLETSLVAAAAAAPAWAAVPLERRMLLGHRFREELHRREDELLDVLVAEGHPIRLGRWELSCMQRVYSPESLDWYARQMVARFEVPGRQLIVHRKPDGVVCFNPPQNTAGASAALATLVLMAGNSVVLRAPRSVPLSAMFVVHELIAPLLEEIGAPPGTLNAVCSNPKQTLDLWVESPLVDDIFFIGDSDQGLRFERQCVANGKKPILELAGNDCIVVWSDADVEFAAEAAIESFYGSGQICMVPNCVVAHPAIADELIAAIERLLPDVRCGYPSDERVLLSPVRRAERFFDLLRQAIDCGAELISGGARVDVDGEVSDTGVFLQPTVIRVDGLADARKVDAVRRETFFPLLPVVCAEPAADGDLLDRMIEFVNTNIYGLRNSLWARSEAVVDAFVTRVVNGGLLKVNDSHIGFLPYLPSHGGTGATGGVFGEANYPMLKTSRLQGVSIATGIRPPDAVFGS